MAIKVAINGFGRIGRMVCRVLSGREDFELVHINDLAEPAALAHLLKYDSVHGKFDGTVEAGGSGLIINGKEVEVTAEKDPSQLPWKEKDIYFVVESTGVFRTMDACCMHLDKFKAEDGSEKEGAGAQKVLLTVPAKSEIDATIVMGVNNDALKPTDRVISNASCTTNCLAPMVKVLHDSFGIEKGLMTTVHAYTNDQRIADLIHKDMRRARAGAMNIIPTTTGAAKAIGSIIPDLNGKLNGMAMRVPVPDGSVVDFVALLKKNATPDEVNAAMKAAAEGPMKGILAYCEDEIVSSDVIGDSHSCIFDAPSTMLIGDNMVKVVGWYDNEWAYSVRVVDLMALAASLS